MRTRGELLAVAVSRSIIDMTGSTPAGPAAPAYLRAQPMRGSSNNAPFTTLFEIGHAGRQAWGPADG